MAQVSSSLIVRLIDQVSSPARVATRSLDRMQAGIRGAAARNSAALGVMRGKLVDAVIQAKGLAEGLGRPIANAAEFQSVLLDIAQKADMTAGQSDALKKRMLELSTQFGKSATEMGTTFDNFIGKGMTPQSADAIIAPIAKVATAYRASMDDVASAGFSAMSNMKVPADQISKAFEIMAEAGKRGAFELKDMAAEFPSLTGSAQTLGLTGLKGVAQLTAALQIARKLTATGGEASTNISDLMNKFTAPEATGKFAKVGIDVRKEMEAAAKEGKDLFVTMANITNRATGGKQNRIGDFFGDKQARQGITALVQNLQEYQQIRDASFAKEGGIDKDFADRQQTMAAAMERFSAAAERLSIVLGDGLIAPFQRFLSVLEPVIARVQEFAAANPRLVGTLGTLAATLLSVNIALTGFRYAGLLTGGQVLNLAAGILKLIRPIQLVTEAMTVLKLAVIGTGIGAVLVGIATAGTWIYNNWSGIVTAFKAFGDEITKRFPGLQPIISKVGEIISSIFGVLGDLTGKVDASSEAWARFGTAMADKVANAVTFIQELPGKILGILQALPGQLYSLGVEMINQLLDGIKTQAQAVLDYFSGLAAQIRRKVGGAISGFVGPNGGGTAPAADPMGNVTGQATGGPVTGGRSYLVGERGPELFRPRSDGSITPNKWLGGGVRVGVGQINIHGVQDPRAIADRVVAEISARVDKQFRAAQGDLGPGFV